MEKLIVKLKQHSPLIHFQHDQEGVTLRASEVKPRLDRFIISSIGKQEKNSTTHLDIDDYTYGAIYAKEHDWLVGKGEKYSLDYKLKIINHGKTATHTIKVINDQKNFLLLEDVQLYFQSYSDEITELIKKYIVSFFIVNNIGFRQSKGYGSFTVESINNKGIKYSTSDYVDALSKFYYQKIKFYEFDVECFNCYSTKYILRKQRNDRNLYINNKYFIPDEFIVGLSDICFNEQRKNALLNHFEQWANQQLNKISDSQLKQFYAEKLRENIEEEKRGLLFYIHTLFIDIADVGFNEKKFSIGGYKNIKSGDTSKNIKPIIFQYFKEKNINWEKRFFKQEITKILKEKGITYPKLKTTHSNKEIVYEENIQYNYVRALLGLAEQFEFQTEDRNVKYIVSVKSSDNDIQRFQSPIIIKIIDDTVFFCFKKAESINPITGKEFTFSLTQKNLRTNISSDLGSFSHPISTPSLQKSEIEDLYERIIQYLKEQDYD